MIMVYIGCYVLVWFVLFCVVDNIFICIGIFDNIELNFSIVCFLVFNC